ncbi:MAG: efflux RND transporter periplasmic adaptor subunit [Deltaproteobacteria bacterium]|nr:efflux RND transporter periplasmic adaptor subunit [Deltaproteobacteria bacterium]
MKIAKWIILMACLAAGGYYYIIPHGAVESLAAADTPSENPVAGVVTAPVTYKIISEKITAYGTVVPVPGAIKSISVPFESRVVNITVNQGLYVPSGSGLIDIEPSEDSSLKMREAVETYEAARQNLEKVRERFNLNMAVNEELIAAKHGFQDAGIRLNNLKKRGIAKKRQIRSGQAGLIYMIHVRRGEIVPAGAPLLDILPTDSIGVRLGVEQEDVKRLKVGQPVLISRVNRDASVLIKGSISMISKLINPATRLVNIFVSVNSSDGVLLGEYVRGEIIIVSRDAPVVPRSAVLPEDGHYILYTVKSGKAVKHIVTPGLDNNREIEILDNGIKPGDRVVILGNYELKDRMPVLVEADK